VTDIIKDEKELEEMPEFDLNYFDLANFRKMKATIRALWRVAEAAIPAAANMDDMTATREMRETFDALRAALDAYKQMKEPSGG